MNRYIAFFALVCCMVYSSCSGVKNLTKPKAEMPASFTSISKNDSSCIADMGWWEFYSDSVLCQIISRTLDNNKDLLAAEAKMEEMRQLYGIDKVNMLPEAGLNVYADNETNNYSGKGTKSGSEYGLKVPVSWEINLLGSLSWARKKGKASYMASAEDYHAMQVALIATAAEAYFRLVALENEYAIVSRTVETRKESLRMAKIRFEGGLTSETVYQQAMVEYSTAASLVPNLKKQLTAARNALTLLMGEFPDESLASGKTYLSPIQFERLPLGLPSQLLQRRPDVCAAEQRLAAAMAAAGMTYADRFPSLRIGLTPGFENDALSDFFKSPFTYVIGTISGTVFDFGRKKRKYRAAVAAYEQARLQYEKAVITAFTEVNTAVNAYKEARESCSLKAGLLEAAEKYNELAQVQYRGGSLNYIDVLDAQRRYFDAQVGMSNAVRDEYFALIDLYKTLGGGWSLQSAESQPIK